jgi:NAD(P)-dependent dehydrogenase (short-subunit alcohol dehydrogenase family)
VRRRCSRGRERITSLEFAGLRVAITDGSSGVGVATARLLVEGGALVAALDRAASEGTDTLLGVPCDVRDDRSVRAAIDHVVARFGGLDVVINIARLAAHPAHDHESPTGWHNALDVNVLAMARVTRAALPHLRRSARAAIVNTASIAASVGVTHGALQRAAKSAIQTLTLAMAADHLVDGIRVNCVEPGTAHPPWVAREVAQAIAYLASSRSAATTGMVLSVDGERQPG